MESYSFEPIASPNATILILGTMPGIKSLELGQYYGHKQNNFWKLVFSIFKEDITDDYQAKKEILLKNNIALWDVLKYCDRVGSLDSAIKNEITNDFEAFLKEHSDIKTILFNGQKAAAFFKKHIPLSDDYKLITLPSTSPANASKSFEIKRKEWEVILELQQD
ncbi:DNA-deoxyinosine glycosylase [Flavobacterium sp. 140616W15]|uniref:DNA-deoxyinosine glycosylase n=1 Tax=Flavobacterium sp. 140616W15 TaxID=2478552 RepID=UPI000F0CF684|nr:DNA-deoxyinosine glycosylase [Flavobacterium sp. 140616W15]AYN04227.1 DNA-deoxyinosine glycosylase [Flavobacterium sp. 140616W15]